MIQKPIALSQIKRKIGQASYSLQQFKADMHQLWHNARTYNQEDSWVYNAAEDMQEHFDKMWDEEVEGKSASNGGDGGGGDNATSPQKPSAVPQGLAGEDTSNGASGTSTPMFKANAAKIPTKIKISLGGGGGAGGAASGSASRRKEVLPDPSESGSDQDEDDDDDDDY